MPLRCVSAAMVGAAMGGGYAMGGTYAMGAIGAGVASATVAHAVDMPRLVEGR